MYIYLSPIFITMIQTCIAGRGHVYAYTKSIRNLKRLSDWCTNGCKIGMMSCNFVLFNRNFVNVTKVGVINMAMKLNTDHFLKCCHRIEFEMDSLSIEQQQSKNISLERWNNFLKFHGKLNIFYSVFSTCSELPTKDTPITIQLKV